MSKLKPFVRVPSNKNTFFQGNVTFRKCNSQKVPALSASELVFVSAHFSYKVLRNIRGTKVFCDCGCLGLAGPAGPAGLAWQGYILGKGYISFQEICFYTMWTIKTLIRWSITCTSAFAASKNCGSKDKFGPKYITWTPTFRKLLHGK